MTLRSLREESLLWAEVDTARLEENARRVVASVQPAGVLAVVKAGAYGHGALAAARAFAGGGVASFGVFTAEEALELRRGDVAEPILLMGPLAPRRMEALLEAGVTPTVYSAESAELLGRGAARLGRELDCHLKVDTGMGRLGVPHGELPAFLDWLRSWSGLRLTGLYTHLACAEDDDSPLNGEQIDRFETVLQAVRDAGHAPSAVHLANSAGALRRLGPDADLVRPGLALFGYAPRPDRPPAAGLRPALSVRARVVQRKRLARGARVGYGATWTARRDSVIATVPAGYEEGYRCELGNRAEALVRGRRAPVVGRISMDLTTLDVTGVPEVEVGDVVTLLGEDGGDAVDAWELARHAGTIAWDILCGFDRKIPRISIRDGVPVDARGRGDRRSPA